MGKEELKKRTKQFALRILRLCESLPKSQPAAHISRQLLRAGTSVGANYRAACRAKSVSDFIYKMAIVEEEADECLYWMELLIESEIIDAHRVSDLMKECNEILSIVVSSIKTAKRKSN